MDLFRKWIGVAAVLAAVALTGGADGGVGAELSDPPGQNYRRDRPWRKLRHRRTFARGRVTKANGSAVRCRKSHRRR
jgi:hypothetical protein